MTAHIGGPHLSLSCFCFLREPFLKLPQAGSFSVRGRSSTFEKVNCGKSPPFFLLGVSCFHTSITFCHQPESRLFLRPRCQITVMFRDRPCLPKIRELSAAHTPLHQGRAGPINVNTQHDAPRTLSLSNS